MCVRTVGTVGGHLVLTQLFFFFFLASCSFRLPMLEWLVMLFRLVMLSDEFSRLISSSAQHNSREQKLYRLSKPGKLSHENWRKNIKGTAASNPSAIAGV